ncbi:MAG: HEAT repeat domain-containing protein [Microcoleus sp.]
MTPQLDEIYVPLAIVERKLPKPPSRNQPEEKEEEKLIPIAEERFFEDVLRQGKSQISQGRKIAIIGEPGSGKTTRLQKIADWILEQDLGLPIWISLADLTQPTITQYIEEIWLKQTGKSLTIDELTQQKHRIWLLLDGLDEMTSRVETRHVSALLGGWVQAARVVVTCRVNVWEADKNAFSGFDVFRNLEFNPEQVRDYIRRWFAGMGDAAMGESLEAALAQSENSRLKELIQNPLRLWMLCQIWQTGGGLPETQAGLYGQFVDWVYDWKADEEILDQREAIDTALARLALAAMEQKDEVSRLRLPESWVLKVLGSRPIFQAVMKLGWLNRVERLPEAICVFYHATFQEYFAALAVDDWDYFLPRNHVNFPVVEKEYQIFEPQWKQVILLWLGREDVADEEKEGFIEKLVSFDDGCGEWNFEKVDRGFYEYRAYFEEIDRGFYEYRAYFLAASGTSEFKTCSVADQIVSKMVKWGVDYFDDFKVKHDGLLTWFHSIKKEIIKILPEINREKVILKLLFLIKNNNNQEISIRRGVSHILKEIAVGNEKAIAELIHLLETPVDEDISWMAAKILENIAGGYKKAITTLIQLLNKTENKNTRIEIVNILMRIDIGDEQVITALIQFVQNNTYEEIPKNNIALYLREIAIGHPKWILAVIQRLQIITDDLSTTFYQWLILCLGEIAEGDKNAILALINLLNQATDQDTIQQIIKSLGRIAEGDKNAILALINLLNQATDQDTIQQIIKSLGEIAEGDKEAILALIELINQVNSPDILEQIGKILGKIAGGNQEAISALINLLQNSPNKYFRLGGDSTLSLISSQEIKFDLDKVTGDLTHLVQHSPNLLTRKLALRTLSKITEEHQNKLIKFDSSGIIESHKYNQEEISQLIYSIETYVDDKSIARSAVYELGEIAPQGHEEAIRALIYAIENSIEWKVRIDALESLLKITPKGHISTIKIFLNIIKNNHYLARESTIVLKEITTKIEMPNLVNNLKDCINYQREFEPYKIRRNRYIYDIILHCAQNLPYPDFYRAWHGLTETQTLKLAQLPQLLQTQLTETNLHQTLQLLCIDRTKFDHPDRPATDIYLQLVKKHHCPKSTEGTPRTLTELKSYWQLLDWEKHPILIFYEEAKPQGFSQTFLDSLTRFDATICVITDSPHPTILTFSPQDPHLIQTIMNWLQRTILES